MLVKDLTEDQLAIIFKSNPDWVFSVDPHFVATYHWKYVLDHHARFACLYYPEKVYATSIETLFNNRPDWLVVHADFWLIKNKPEYAKTTCFKALEVDVPVDIGELIGVTDG